MVKKLLLGLMGSIVLILAASFIWLLSRYEAFPDQASVDTLELPGSPLPADFRAELSKRLSAFRAEHNVPSVSVAVGVDGKLAYAEAVGYAYLDDQVPATVDSLYRIGSVSKSVTAVVLGHLMDTGQIDIDTSFESYVPSFPDKNWAFTLRQLASHTAGIRHYRSDFLDSLNESYHTTHYETVLDSLVLVENDPLLFEPGTAFQYSSYGYNVLSAALVAAAGVPFTHLLKSAVFDPAGMPFAHAENVLDPHPKTVGYYLQYEEQSLLSPFVDNSYKIAGGGIIATPGELVAFGLRLLDGTLISTSTMKELFTPMLLRDGSMNPQNYGLGFRISQRELGGTSVREVSHGGSSVGGLTSLLMFPEVTTSVGRSVNVVIAVTINITAVSSLGYPQTIAYDFADRIIRELNDPAFTITQH